MPQCSAKTQMMKMTIEAVGVQRAFQAAWRGDLCFSSLSLSLCTGVCCFRSI